MSRYQKGKTRKSKTNLWSVDLDNGQLNVLMVYAPHSGKMEEEKEFLE